MTAHLDDAAWEQLMTGELADRAERLRHVMACPECAAVYKGLLALERDAQAAGLIEAPAPARSGRRAWWIGGAAVLAAAAALLLYWQRPRASSRDDTLRGGGAAEISLTSPDGHELQWTTVPGAISYRVTVFKDDGTPVWSKQVETPPVTWPGAAPGTYRWKVEARDGQRVLARSKIELLVAP